MPSPIRFEPDPRMIGQVMLMPEVRAGLRAAAEPVAARARTLARAEISEEFAADIHITEDVRPKGRPTATIEADRQDAEAHEFGDTTTARRRILGRAARTPEGE